jgi:hypothetical protein
VATGDEGVAVDELRNQRVSRRRARLGLAVGDVHPVGLVQQRGMDRRVRDHDRLATRRGKSNAHVTRIVAGGYESAHSLRELEVARHGLEAILEREDAPLDVRPSVLRASKCERVAMHDVARPREERDTLEIGVPPDVVDVHVREKHDVDLVASNAEGVQRARKHPFLLRGPVPEPGRADAGVDEDRDAGGPDEEAAARDAPAVAGEELVVEGAVRRPCLRRDLGIRLAVVGENSDSVGNREELDRADYHRTRGGVGSPCASSQETTGFRSTPIRSISASMTSPGLR